MKVFMKSELNMHDIEALKIYFQISGDKRPKIVDFTPGFPSRFLQGPEVIGEGKENFVIVDPFDGADPIVLNHKFLVQRNGTTLFLAGIILDSQTVSYIHKFVTDPTGEFRASPRGRSTRKLLEWIARANNEGWDCNPFFYFLESTSKVAFDQVFPHAQEYAESILGPVSS